MRRRLRLLAAIVLALLVALPGHAALSASTVTTAGTYLAWSVATVTGTATGTTAQEVTITLPQPWHAGSAIVLVTGDVNTAVFTATLRDSRFAEAEADLMSATGTVASNRAGIAVELVNNLTKDASVALPPGSYVFRLVSNNAGSTGPISGTLTFLHSE